MNHIHITITLLFFYLFCGQNTTAQTLASATNPTDSLPEVEMPEITILGKEYGLFTDIPGSVKALDRKEIQRLQPLSGNEVFRRVPGLHVVDEEGLGLRINIGIRGLDPDRSRSVLILEDGIPVALNPYGEPEMYYTPAMERMTGVEILKGSGQILFGPQTIGGVVNYVTSNPPTKSAGFVRLRGADGGFFTSMVGYGNTFGKTGFQVNFLRKQADNVGMLDFRVNDLTAKFRHAISENASLSLKLGWYNEVSNATYVGLTQNMYDAGGEFDFARIAPNDELTVKRYSASVTHDWRIKDNIRLQTTAFGFTTARNWRRQDFSYDPNASNQTGVVWGDESIVGGAIYMRNGTGNRDRQFEVAGIEPRLSIDYNLGNLPNELQIGARFMYERAYEQRINGSTPEARSGALRESEIRTGQAISFYIQNKFEISEKFNLSAGLRAEIYDYERDILRLNNQDVNVLAKSNTNQLIPGLGFNYAVHKNFLLFGGIHRGFAPPRVKDAIANTGEVYNLDAELSWNSELGFRGDINKIFIYELTAFNMDFSNQIIPVSASSGAAGAGLVNGGQTLHRGVELGFGFDLARLLDWKDYLLSLDLNATYVNAVYNKDRFAEIEGAFRNLRNNRTPYAPEWFFSSALTFETPFGLGLRFTGSYTGAQFTDELNTVAPSANGRAGLMPSFFVLDATVLYQIPKINTSLNLAIKNLTDERYITSRRPEGIRVGLPRLVVFGAEFRF